MVRSEEVIHVTFNPIVLKQILIDFKQFYWSLARFDILFK